MHEVEKMEKKNIAPIRLELLVTIIDRKKTEFYADVIQSYDVNMQMILAAKGTAEKKMLEYLGLSDNEKSVILSVVREDRLDMITEALEERFSSIKGGKGISVSIPMTSIMGATAFGFLSNELFGADSYTESGRT